MPRSAAGPARSIAAPFWLLAPVHAALPYALWVLHQRGGLDAVLKAIAAIHLGFPVLHAVVRSRLPYRDGQLAWLVTFNHLAVLVGGLALWLWLALR